MANSRYGRPKTTRPGCLGARLRCGARYAQYHTSPSVRRADLPRRQRGRRLGQLRGQRLTGQCPTRAEFGGLFRPQPGLGPGQVYQLAHQCRGAAEPGLCRQPARVDLGERVEHHRMHHPRRAFNSTNEIEYRNVVQSGQRRTHLVRAGGDHLYRRVSVASRAYSRNRPRQSAGPSGGPAERTPSRATNGRITRRTATRVAQRSPRCGLLGTSPRQLPVSCPRDSMKCLKRRRSPSMRRCTTPSVVPAFSLRLSGW